MCLFKKYDSFRLLPFMVTAGMIIFVPLFTTAQFAPPAGQPGTTAISADSSVFVAWASSCVVERGYMDISDTTLGKASYGEDTLGVGVADNGVVSLGDGGSAVLYFQIPLTDGPGYDFAVFENSFSDDFLELAFVEVSSDGERYFRFESVSNTQTEEQVEAFGTLDATKISHLAGKYRGGYGTPFDLAELQNTNGLDIHHIVAVRIVDVVGSIDPEYGTYDSDGHIINDPWPTPFESSGFDLDAVGVIHDQNNMAVNELPGMCSIRMVPNPAESYVKITDLDTGSSVLFFDGMGCRLVNLKVSSGHELTVSLGDFPKGWLFVQVIAGNRRKIFKLIHN